MANSADPDQTLHTAASDLVLHCLQSLSVPKLMAIMVSAILFFKISASKSIKLMKRDFEEQGFQKINTNYILFAKDESGVEGLSCVFEPCIYRKLGN